MCEFLINHLCDQASRTELKNLLERPQLAGIPVLVRVLYQVIVLSCSNHGHYQCCNIHNPLELSLRKVLGNKRDLPGALDESELIQMLGLNSVQVI